MRQVDLLDQGASLGGDAPCSTADLPRLTTPDWPTPPACSDAVEQVVMRHPAADRAVRAGTRVPRPTGTAGEPGS